MVSLVAVLLFSIHIQQEGSAQMMNPNMMGNMMMNPNMMGNMMMNPNMMGNMMMNPNMMNGTWMMNPKSN